MPLRIICSTWMKDKQMHNSPETVDVASTEELMELVFLYTAAAHDFGFTHKMNNRFTALSMNASFLKQALERQDYDKAQKKADQVYESIQGLIEFSQELLSSDQLPQSKEELQLPDDLHDILATILALPSFEEFHVTTSFDPVNIRCKINSAVIRVFLYAFLKNIQQFQIQGPIIIGTAYDANAGIYTIKTDVEKIITIPTPKPEGSSLIFPSAGAIPMRYFARVIKNHSNQFDLVHHPEHPLTLEFSIQISPIL